MFKKTWQAMVIAGMVLFGAICASAETPAFQVQVSKEKQSTLQIKVAEDVKFLSCAEDSTVVFGKTGNGDTVNLGKKMLFISCPPPGKSNITICGAIKINGQNGSVFIANYGATNLIIPGYRLEAKVKDGKVILTLLLVGYPEDLEKELYRYTVINTPKEKAFETGKWVCFGCIINRQGQADIFVDGELVISGSAKIIEPDDIKKPMATMINYDSAGDVSLELADVENYYSLLSTVAVKKFANEWLEMLQK